MSATNNQRIHRRFSRAQAYEQYAEVQRDMAQELAQAIPLHFGRQFDALLEIGCGTGLLTRFLFQELQVATYYANDLIAACQAHLHRTLSPAIRFLPGAIETLTNLPDSLDLVVSNAALQWIEPLPPFVKTLQRRIKPGGGLAIATFGPENFKEFDILLNLRLHYLSIAEWQEILLPDFEILLLQEKTRVLYFPTALAVFKHLRNTGVNSLQAPQWSRSRWQTILQTYQTMFQTPDGVTLSYHPVTLIARRRA